MLYDDRLATVLTSPVGGEAAARTQYRQLVDLLGNRSDGAEFPVETYRRLAARADSLSAEDRQRLIERPALAGRNPRLLVFLAQWRLEQLARRIPAEERSRILREPGLRLRNPALVELLAGGDAKPAAAAVATARLSEEQWTDLIPRLPVMARGFLRHRRDLPPAARDLLHQLGVRDHVLPRPDGDMPQPVEAEEAPAAAPAPAEPGDEDGIRALLRRIEAFREGRRPGTGDPRLPLGDTPDQAAEPLPAQFAFTTDSRGRIDWADGIYAPLACGLRLTAAAPGALAVLDDADLATMQLHLPLAGAKLLIDAAPAISGDWRIDAEPVFAPDDGSFRGYRGRLRRPVLAEAQVPVPADSQQDRMRQVLHELRTPVNAIQGFAEIIQQQIFGHAPNAYRAHAAAIAVDAAKLLASFDEIDRLAKLESGALVPEPGEADLREVLADTIRRLDGALRPRNAGFDLTVSGSPFTIAVERDELLGLSWRLLASLAASLGPGERLATRLEGDGTRALVTIDLPSAMNQVDDPYVIAVPEQRPAVSAGMFGTGFSFRIARAEVSSLGGEMQFADGRIMVNLPVLTPSATDHSNVTRDESAA